jgi:hypothetical protein
MAIEDESARAGISDKPSEDTLLIDRRALAGIPASPDERIAPRVALALSGGGIRSATFSFGLLRALAKAGTLPHVDYLSTVSGGGYVGSAFARLFRKGRKPEEVRAGLASDDSVLLWWLRNNGRYLTPAGMRDVMQAFASISRGALSTHFEVGMLLVLCACVMLLPTIGLYLIPDVKAPDVSWGDSLRSHFLSPWWVLAAVPLFWAALEIFAFWFWRSPEDRESALVDRVVAGLVAVVAIVIGAALVFSSFWQFELWKMLLAVIAYPLLWTPLAALSVRTTERDENKQKLELAAARLKHTKGLANALSLLLLALAVGLTDVVSYQLVHKFEHLAVSGSFTGMAALVAIGHWVMSHWKPGAKAVKAVATRLGTSQLINLVGIVFLALVVLSWTSLVQWLTLPSNTWPFLATKGLPTGCAMAIEWIVLLVLPAAYVWFTRDGLETLNLSSLHNFYRARLERAYVSTGNSNRFDNAILGPKTLVDAMPDKMRVTKSMNGDDIPIAEHRPHEYGGPIHLVNCCVNQTVDDRTDEYNADRKGVALTISALGVETGTHLPDGSTPPGNLSQWTAISGAAASSGMGSQTTPGAAALLFFSGLRLGYWQSSLLGKRKPSGERDMFRPELIKAECFARFPGLRSPQWYVSDGGHFENTAVYALIKRKIELIVVADCGADPEYLFDDVENLVRKAAIDYAGRIEFVLPPAYTGTEPENDSDARLRGAVGLPRGADKQPVIRNREGDQWLLLARIRYLDGAIGTLVIVKPRVIPGLPLDAAGYASRNTVFPQQTTADQFFDEAQWEAYHQIGVHLGDILTPANLRMLCDWANPPVRPGS